MSANQPPKTLVYRRLLPARRVLKQLGTHADIIIAANKLLARYERRPHWRPR
jgi:hypothetical protein